MSDIRFNRWLHQSGTGGVYQDSTGRVGIGTSVPTSALSVVGVVSATNFTGSLTGNVTGTSITVGDKFISSSGVGLGTTSTTGRNSGVGTAIGTLIVNVTTNQLEVYGPSGWKNVTSLNKTGITATGGTIDTYTSGNAVYKYHTFTSSGFFEVTRTGDFGNSVDFLVIGGGGGGSDTGGGGAGGYRTSMPEGPGGPSPVAESGISVSVVSPGYYTITVGAGGAGGADDNIGVSGSPSSVVNASSSFTPIVSQGGGRGGTGFPTFGPQTGSPGGSAGGGSGNDPANTLGPGGNGNRVTETSTPAPNQGYPGGNSRPDYWTGGGGGGAGGAGTTAPSDPTGGPGGPGKASSITGSPVTRAGGGGGGSPASGGVGGSGGGGTGAAGANGTAATVNTGSGGGGSWGPGGGGAGGSGIVIVRYQISEV